MEARVSLDAELREQLRGVSKLWWLWLAFGIAWT